MTKDEAREIVYGMPYADWVAQNQTAADAAKKAAFAEGLRRKRRQEGLSGRADRGHSPLPAPVTEKLIAARPLGA